MKALASLKVKVQEDYQSTFLFEKYDIDEETKKEVIENKVIIRNFRTMSESMYKVYKALYDTSIKLKSDRSFQVWYENIGLGKDKVSELLKRYNLYIAFPSNFKYITGLSNQAVKLLTAENLDLNILYDIIELCNVKEVRAYKIIRDLNKEGYITISGRVNKSYLLKKLGVEKGTTHASL